MTHFKKPKKHPKLFTHSQWPWPSTTHPKAFATQGFCLKGGKNVKFKRFDGWLRLYDPLRPPWKTLESFHNTKEGSSEQKNNPRDLNISQRMIHAFLSSYLVTVCSVACQRNCFRMNNTKSQVLAAQSFQLRSGKGIIFASILGLLAVFLNGRTQSYYCTWFQTPNS